MTSHLRFKAILWNLTTAAIGVVAVVIATGRVSAQSLTLNFRFDGQTGAAATTQTITTANNGQSYTIDVWATVVGASPATTPAQQAQLGLESLRFRGFSVLGGAAFSTGAGIGTLSGSGTAFESNGGSFAAGTIADAGSTTDGSAANSPPTANATLDGIADFGNGPTNGSANGVANASGLSMQFGGGTATATSQASANQGWEFMVGQYVFKLGNASSTGGARTTYLPTVGQGSTSTMTTWTSTGQPTGATATHGAFAIGTGVSFVVGGGPPPSGSILNMTPATVTINSLTNGTNSSTLAVANTSATDAGTYTGAFTGTSAGATQNPTGTVNVPASGSVNEVITYAAPAAVGAVSFGYTITNTANATDVQAAGANKSTAFTVNVGNAVADNGNALPNAANPFTNATTMTAVVAHGSSYQGLESQVTSLNGTGGFNADDGSPAHKGGTAIILAGSNNVANGGGAATVAMQWRTLSTNASFNEQSGLSPTGPSGKIYNLSLLRPTTGLVSNVVNVTGLTPGAESAGGATDPFVLQMSFNPVLTAKHGTVVTSLAQNKLINLISYNPTTNLWDRAVDDNTGNAITSPLDASFGYVGSYATYISAGQPGNGKTLAQTLGAWGVDPINDVVWADVNHNSQFAVVPEPGTILLAGLGLMGLVGLRRRMKAAAA